MRYKNKIKVPQDISSIQKAVYQALNGTEIIVSPGKYRENIDFRGKKVRLRSTDPSDKYCRQNTIIAGKGEGSVIKFTSGEDRDSALEGFTITGGSGTEYKKLIDVDKKTPFRGKIGGGISVRGSSPTIRKNIIRDNTAYYGGGVVLICSNALFKDNELINNRAYSGGGINIRGVISESDIVLQVINNSVSSNEAESGGGLSIEFCESQKEMVFNKMETLKPGILIEDNTICRNKASESGGGINIAGILNVLFGRNKIYRNTLAGKEVLGAGLHIWEAHYVTLAENNIYKNNLISDSYFAGDQTPGAGLCLRDSDTVMEENRIYENYFKQIKNIRKDKQIKVEDNISLYFDAVIRNVKGKIIDSNYY